MVINLTPYAAQAIPMREPDGRQVVVAIVKATFDVIDGERLALADEPRGLRMNDEPWDIDSEWSSLRYPSDLCPRKLNSDVVVVADAVAEPGATVVDVAVRIRKRTVALRVHGPRVYYEGPRGIMVGPAAKFERQPIVYEAAYGGATADYALVERRNPAGRGVAKTPADLLGKAAPQIEHPAHPIADASPPPDPVGFGAIPSHWQPRSDFAGTFDEQWQAERMPLMPTDFDWRSNNVAHPALVLDAPIAAGDPIATVGLVPGGATLFEVPELQLQVDAKYDDGKHLSLRPVIDTVLYDVSLGCLELVARHAFALGRGSQALREVRASLVD